MNRVPKHLTDEWTLDVVEELISLAGDSGMPITHMAMAFAVSHPTYAAGRRGRNRGPA